MKTQNPETSYGKVRHSLSLCLAVFLAILTSACEIPNLGGNDEALPDSTPVSSEPGQTGEEQQEPGDDEELADDDSVPPQLPDEAFQIDPDEGAAPDDDPVRVVEGGLQEPRTLNPVLVDDPIGEELSQLVFSGLTRLHPETGDPEPDLASDWEVDDDAMTYRFQIRDGVTWHDGQPLTAQDVEFTFELMMDNRTRSPRLSRIVERVAAVEATDARTVEFRLLSPYSALPSTIATFGIVPQHILGNVLPDELVAEPFGTSNTVGTGPFELVHWERGERIVFETNRNHHLNPAQFDQYEYRIPPDTESFLAELEDGQIDWGRISVGIFEDVESLGNIETVAIPSFEMVSVVLQLDPGVTAKFESGSVRQALMHALDRDEMVDEIWGGRADVAHSIIPSQSWAAAEPETRYEFDPARAGELLDEAGWTLDDDVVRQRDGEPFELNLLANGDNPVRRELAEWLVTQWQDVGIDARVTFETWSNVREQITSSRDFESLLFGYRWNVDPDQHAMWSSDSITGGFNLAGYMNQDVDQEIEDALGSTDRETRAQSYAEMQELVLRDLPVLPLAFPNQLVALGSRLHAEEPTAILLRNRAHVAGWIPDEDDAGEPADDA